MGVYDDWQQIYGGHFGYAPSYQRRLYERGAEDINQQYAGMQRQQTAGLAQRGFYSARPMQRMMGQMGAEKTRALSQYRQGIQQQSEQLAQRQKGQLFQATAQETMQAKQQEYALSRMDKQQQYTVLNMNSRQQHELAMMYKRFQHDENMAHLRDDLNKKGWGHLLGAVVGGALGSFLGPVGTAAGASLGGAIFGGDDDDDDDSNSGGGGN